MWWDVKVQVQGLFIQGGCDAPVIVDGKGYIHEVAFIVEWSEIPLEAMEVVDFGLEFIEQSAIGSWVLVVDPDAKDIVNKSLVEGDSVSPGWKHVKFVYAKEDGSIRWGWRDPHGCAGKLAEECIAEGEDIIAEDEIHGGDESFCMV